MFFFYFKEEFIGFIHPNSLLISINFTFDLFFFGRRQTAKERASKPTDLVRQAMQRTRTTIFLVVVMMIVINRTGMMQMLMHILNVRKQIKMARLMMIMFQKVMMKRTIMIPVHWKIKPRSNKSKPQFKWHESKLKWMDWSIWIVKFCKPWFRWPQIRRIATHSMTLMTSFRSSQLRLKSLWIDSNEAWAKMRFVDQLWVFVLSVFWVINFATTNYST